MIGKKINWNKLNKGVFLVNTLGIIYDPSKKRILIAKRIDDSYIKNLTWCFPGAIPSYRKDLEKSLEKNIKNKTGLRVKNLGCVFSRIFKENKQFLLMYYLCEVVGGKENPSKDLTELKWVKPEEIQDYFTTSFDKRLREYIMNLK